MGAAAAAGQRAADTARRCPPPSAPRERGTARRCRCSRRRDPAPPRCRHRFPHLRRGGAGGGRRRHCPTPRCRDRVSKPALPRRSPLRGGVAAGVASPPGHPRGFPPTSSSPPSRTAPPPPPVTPLRSPERGVWGGARGREAPPQSGPSGERAPRRRAPLTAATPAIRRDRSDRSRFLRTLLTHLS